MGGAVLTTNAGALMEILFQMYHWPRNHRVECAVLRGVIVLIEQTGGAWHTTSIGKHMA